MVAPYLQKACLLTALACMVIVPGAAAESSNPEEPPETDGEQGTPCDIIVTSLEYPFIAIHPECLPSLH